MAPGDSQQLWAASAGSNAFKLLVPGQPVSKSDDDSTHVVRLVTQAPQCSNKTVTADLACEVLLRRDLCADKDMINRVAVLT